MSLMDISTAVIMHVIAMFIPGGMCILSQVCRRFKKLNITNDSTQNVVVYGASRDLLMYMNRKITPRLCGQLLVNGYSDTFYECVFSDDHFDQDNSWLDKMLLVVDESRVGMEFSRMVIALRCGDLRNVIRELHHSYEMIKMLYAIFCIQGKTGDLTSKRLTMTTCLLIAYKAECHFGFNWLLMQCAPSLQECMLTWWSRFDAGLITERQLCKMSLVIVID
jgi:hypothetical protein